jgi:cytoskeletal protein CcmA (bactofilin family)
VGQAVDESSRVLVISSDTSLKGDIRNGGRIEIYGYVEGNIAGDLLIVQPGGRCYGTVRVESADIHGTLQGEVFVKQLITIRTAGAVNGNVQYGRLAMEMGGNLSAEVRNVPPTLAGDLDLSVDKGKSVRITLQDLTALDPDDDAQHLTFTVSRAKNGFVTLLTDPGHPVATFTQADLERGSVLFRHDGTNGAHASFDVVVADHAGATSGAAQTVNVSVRA